MPVKYREAYNANPNAGDSLKDDDYFGFEEDKGAGNRSDSWGGRLSQLVTYLGTKFFTQVEVVNYLLGYIPKVTTPVAGNAVVLNAQGTLQNAGAPLMTVEIETATVPNWARMSHVAQNHSLSKVPDLVQVSAVFNIAYNGYSQDDEIVLGLGNAGGAAYDSAIAVALTSTTFQIMNSSGSTAVILVPDANQGNNNSIAVTETEVSLKVTLIALQATA